ncbi:MAG: hypothetical protein ACRELY_09505, partial [Polyangiaceae bacterium]
AGNGDDAGSSGANSYGGGGGGGGGGGSSSDGGTSSAKDSGGGGGGGGCTAFTGVLAAFDFTGAPGDQASTSPSSSAPGIGAGDVTRSSSVTGTTGADSMNSSGWGTGSSADTSKYYTFTITPDSKCALDITSVSVDSKASGTGPAKGAVATSDDSFGSKTAFTPGSAGSVTASVSGASGALEIRVYGYSASSGSGTFRVQNTLAVNGSLH